LGRGIDLFASLLPTMPTSIFHTLLPLVSHLLATFVVDNANLRSNLHGLSSECVLFFQLSRARSSDYLCRIYSTKPTNNAFPFFLLSPFHTAPPSSPDEICRLPATNGPRHQTTHSLTLFLCRFSYFCSLTLCQVPCQCIERAPAVLHVLLCEIPAFPSCVGGEVDVCLLFLVEMNVLVGGF